MNEDLKKRVEEFMDSETGKAIKTLVAYTILKTKTVKDDEVLENIDDVIEIIAENISQIAEVKPSDKEAKDATMVVVKLVVDSTENKWDDRIFNILDMFF